MIIKRLYLKNIRSYEEQTIEFPEGSVLLSGDVGSGKTTILLALEYALFGFQPGQKGSALLRNSSSQGEVIAELEVEGKSLIIHRCLKREGNSITNEYSAITYDNQKEECSVTELKSKILQILGYPSEFLRKNNLLYRYTIYTPQESMKQIILEDADTRLNILRHVFGIEKYKRIRENLTLLISHLKDDSKTFQAETKYLEEDNAHVKEVNSLIQGLSNSLTEQSLKLEEEVKKREKIETESIALEKKIREKEVFEKEIEKTNLLIDTKRETKRILNIELEELSRSIIHLGKPFEESEYNLCLAKLKSLNESLDFLNKQNISLLGQYRLVEQNQMDNLNKKERIFKIDICPTCLQDVSDNHKHNILNETENKLSDLKRQKGQLDEQKLRLVSEINQKRQEIQDLEKEKLSLEILKSRTEFIENAYKKKQTIIKQQEAISQDLDLLEKHTTHLKEGILKFSKFDNIYKKTKEDLRTALLIERKSEISLAESRKEKSLLEKSLLELQEKIIQKESIKIKLNNSLSIIDWLSNYFLKLVNFTEIQIMLRLRREFALFFSNWFQMIAGDTFTIRLDENFTPIINQGEIEMEYSFLSGGERTAIALAYRLALNQTINSIMSDIKTKDLVILDEPTEGFSEAQIDKIRDVLEELNTKQLIMVSHETKIGSFVDNIIKVKKIADSTQIEDSNQDEITQIPEDQKT
ncbi:hypothetical protein COU54_01965 [Candidatus Pacearchaeota archaeon CG10_big_fil_rev_8_21_14_0_10_31_24]|nr:MAG: hypothetical protein COU54_01965 [Candidatus Pacearchaeota archaeon CG10_big_fil_rev_8_21_14_0_10_31_24]